MMNDKLKEICDKIEHITFDEIYQGTYACEYDEYYEFEYGFDFPFHL